MHCYTALHCTALNCTTLRYTALHFIGNPEFSCKAKALDLRREDGTFGLINETGDHNHDCIEAEIIADEMKVRMCEIVKKDPSAPVGDAIKKAKA